VTPVRLKAIPEDFQVEEHIALPSGEGFTLYRVCKVGVTTLAVQRAIAQRLDLRQRDVVFPAQKDRQAIAVQFASVRGKGPAYLTGKGWEATRVGEASRPLSPHDLVGNAFLITLRDMGEEEASRLRQGLRERGEEGLPNYFDRQRFGSLAPGEGFLGKALLLGDAPKALRLFLATPFPGESPALTAFKALVRRHWGRWSVLLPRAPRGPLRSVLTYLKDHPTDLAGAVDRIAPGLLSLALSAYQAWLWNAIAGRWLEALAGPFLVEQRLVVAERPLPLYRALPPQVRERLSLLRLPLPHHKMTFPDQTAQRCGEEVLAAEGLTPHALKARRLTHAFLARGERPLLLFPRDVTVGIPQPDDLSPGRWKVQVSFSLPPGSYATLVVKVTALLAGVPLTEGETPTSAGCGGRR